MVPAIAPDVTISRAGDDPAVFAVKSMIAIAHRPPRQLSADAFALAQPPALAAPYQALNDPRHAGIDGHFIHRAGFGNSGDCGAGSSADPTVVLQIPVAA